MGNYTTLATVKAWLGLTVTSDDTLLTALITRASALMDDIMSRTLLTASYTEWRDGPGGQFISTRNYPITAVAGVSVDGVAILPSPDALTAGYGFTPLQVFLRDYKFTRGVQNVQLQYTAGLSAAPADVEQACIELVAFKYRGRNWIGQSSKILQGENVTFRTEDVPREVMATLKGYQRVIPI
jgi:hypothetical protein